MVRKRFLQKRSGFTIIELSFSILILAISVMSLPMMTQVISNNIEDNLAQEAIFAAAAQINLVTTHTWDENSRLDYSNTNSIGYDLSRVINLNNECFGTGIFEGAIEINKRVGHIHRRCLSHNIDHIYYGVNFQESLEVFVHDFSPIYIATQTSGYKKEYDSKLEVIRCNSQNCMQFGLESNNINLKEIRVSIREKDDDTNETLTLLRTYSANIGEVAYARESL